MYVSKSKRHIFTRLFRIWSSQRVFGRREETGEPWGEKKADANTGRTYIQTATRAQHRGHQRLKRDLFPQDGADEDGRPRLSIPDLLWYSVSLVQVY